MKKLLLLLFLIQSTILLAQAPQGFNYQATVRNGSGGLIINQNVNFKFNVMQNTPTSVPVFSETHFAPTDDLGAVNLVIGKGTATTGTFSNIDWGNGTYYLGIELNTGNGYVAMGTTQLLSVPYAMYAKNSGNSQASTPNLAAVLAVENSANNIKITNLADPTNAQDVATKAYVDANTKKFFNFNGFDNYQVWQNNSTLNLVPNSFNFINANNTTLIFPSKPEKCCFGDVIYLYMMQNGENNRRTVTLKPNGFPVAFSETDNSLKWSADNTTQFIGTFNSGLNTIINVGDYWMCATFTNISTLTTPTLTTTATSSITTATASSGGTISNDGGATVIARGVVWSTNSTPTTSLSTKTIDGSGSGLFTSAISGLAAGTTYYVRAYLTNSVGTYYGQQNSFKTLSLNVPTLSTSPIINIKSISAQGGGNITSNGGSIVTERGVVWGTSSNPTISLNAKTADGNGTGSFSSNLSSLILNVTYYARAFATNSIGTGYGNEISFTTNSLYTNGNGVTDNCGITYPTIIIGGKEWMQKNLDVCKYRNGDPIPQVQDMTQWNKLTTGAWCYYENKTENGIVYGKLYNGYAVNDSRGLAPAGWHIPLATDLDGLIAYLGGINLVAGEMKEKGTTHWVSPNTGATNESGFTGLPAGVVALSGAYPNIITVFSGIGYLGGWWVNLNKGPYYGYWLSNNSSALSSGSTDPNSGLSIRCVKD
jgi:uncharacterized protein (TIGR02145 family)